MFALSGACLFFITFPQLWLLVFPGLVLFLAAMANTRSTVEAFWGGWLAGATKLAGALFWLWSAYPLVWLDVAHPAMGLIVVGFFWISAFLVGGLGVALVSVVGFKLWQFSARLSMWTFALWWLCGEILGSLLLSALILGPGTNLNISISYGYTGLALANFTVLLPLAYLGGLYALSLAAAFSSSILYGFLYKQSHALLVAMVFALGFGLVHFVSDLEPNPHGWQGKVIAVDTNFTARELQTIVGMDSKQAQLKEALTQAIDINADFILLPEDSRLTSSFKTPEGTLEYLAAIDPQSQAIIVDSARRPLDDKNVVLRAFVYNLEEGKVDAVDKQFLAPQGEYLPYFYKLILQLFGAEGFIKNMALNQNYTPGPYTEYPQSERGLPGVLFCYASIDTWGTKKVSAYSSHPIVLHPISHSWFHNPTLMWHQLDLMLKVQAVWNQKIIISAGNMSPSKIYYPDGSSSLGQILRKGDFYNLVGYELGQ